MTHRPQVPHVPRAHVARSVLVAAIATFLATTFSTLGVSIEAQRRPPRRGGRCPLGQEQNPDTRGHCCYPGQVWSDARAQCVGAPTCPETMEAQGETCGCADGMEVGPETADRCCWPGQVWSRVRATCVGLPTACPSSRYPVETGCEPLPACADGRVASSETLGNCCWPGQRWDAAARTCTGTPVCTGTLVPGRERGTAAPSCRPTMAGRALQVRCPDHEAGFWIRFVVHAGGRADMDYPRAHVDATWEEEPEAVIFRGNGQVYRIELHGTVAHRIREGQFTSCEYVLE